MGFQSEFYFHRVALWHKHTPHPMTAWLARLANWFHHSSYKVLVYRSIGWVCGPHQSWAIGREH